MSSCSATRVPFVGGNWKSNGTRHSVAELVKGLNAATLVEGVEVIVGPTFVHIPAVQVEIDQTKYKVAAQNSSVDGDGAFTGEISAEQLKDLGLQWVILGHSERRHGVPSESHDLVGRKAGKAQTVGLKVILCVGETLEEREAGNTENVVRAQLEGAVPYVKDWDNVVIAYEPVWAIGTGRVASPEQAQDVHHFIRQWVVDKISCCVAKRVRIIYGGSVKPSNSGELFQKEDIDGFLVGGASLKAAEFVPIVNSCKN